MTCTAKSPYAGYRFPGEVISHAVWLYFRFPLSLRMVEEMLAARGIVVSHGDGAWRPSRKFIVEHPLISQHAPTLAWPFGSSC